MAFILVFPVAAISNEVDISLRREAPVYTGPSQEGDMEELTVEDFENFGLEDDAINTSYTGNRWPWGSWALRFLTVCGSSIEIFR